MKLQTIKRSLWGQKSKFVGNVILAFDKEGTVDVPEEIAKKLLELYPTILFPEGEAPTESRPVRVRKDIPAGNTVETIEVLKERLAEANRLVTQFKAQADAAQDRETLWRQKSAELLKENERLKADLGALKKVETESDKNDSESSDMNDASPTDKNKVPEHDEDLRTQLESKTKTELLQIASELQLPVEEYKRLNKTQLVEYLCKKAENI